MAETLKVNYSDEAPRFFLFNAIWIVASLVLMASTWRLWLGTDQFPQVPLLLFFVGSSLVIDYVALAVLSVVGIGILNSLFRGKPIHSNTIDPKLRIAYGLWAVALMMLFLTNQHRLQPWAWQFFIFAVLLGTSGTKASALTACRVVVVSIYIWSAIGKFDFQFLNGLGRQFAAAITDLVGFSTAAQSISPWVVALMPAGELLVGILLFFSSTRKLGVLAAIGLHLGLVAILGPWGLNHHLGVLIWNLIFAMLTAILFWPPKRQSEHRAGMLFFPAQVVATLFTISVVCLPLLPACDHWLAWGLYSPNNRRCKLRMMVTPNQSIDEAIPPYLVPVESEFIGGLDVLEFDMGRMSLERISAPIYPESRMQLGVASWLQRTFELPGSTVISIEGKSDRFTGERNVQEIESVASADEKAPFFFNHLPR